MDEQEKERYAEIVERLKDMASDYDDVLADRKAAKENIFDFVEACFSKGAQAGQFEFKRIIEDNDDCLMMIKPKTWAADKMPFAFKRRRNYSRYDTSTRLWEAKERKHLKKGPFFEDEEGWGGFYIISMDKAISKIDVKYFAAMQKDCFRHYEFEDDETPIFTGHLVGAAAASRMFYKLKTGFDDDFADVGLKVNFMNLYGKGKAVLFFETSLLARLNSNPSEEFKEWFPKIKKAWRSAKFKDYIRQCLYWVIDVESFISRYPY